MKPLTPAERLEQRLRQYVPTDYAPVDVIYDAADHIRDTETLVQELRATIQQLQTAPALTILKGEAA